MSVANDFKSKINLGLPQVSRVKEQDIREELQDIYAAFRVIQLELDKIKAAIGLP